MEPLDEKELIEFLFKERFGRNTKDMEIELNKRGASLTVCECDVDSRCIGCAYKELVEDSKAICAKFARPAVPSCTEMFNAALSAMKVPGNYIISPSHKQLSIAVDAIHQLILKAGR